MVINKKSQGISINAIIIAAVALIVLVVLVAVFTGKFGEFGIGLKKASGDITKDCGEQSPKDGLIKYGLKTVDECRAIDGGQVIASKDTTGNQVCCTR